MNVFILLFAMSIICAIIVIRANIYSWLKPAVIVAFLFSSILSFSMLHEYLGHPKNVTMLPKEMLVYGQHIDKENDLISLLMKDEADPNPPEYVKYKYKQNLHKALSQGAKAAGGKGPFKISSKGKKGEEGKGKSGNGEDGKDKGNSISLESIATFKHSLPQPKLPDKR